MRHKHCQRLFEFWQSRLSSGVLPDVGDFFSEPTLEFSDRGVVIVREAGDIFYDYCGERLLEALGADILGQSMTFFYSDKFKALQIESASVCFDQHVGLHRYSRFWFGHRHKDVEWLLLPARDSIGNRTVLVGMAATFVKHDELDKLVHGSDLVERIIAQDYLSAAAEVKFDVISRSSWAMLDAMGADVTVNGSKVARKKVAIGGDAAYAARKASAANVLGVADANEFARSAQTLRGLYSFRLLETYGDALAVLQTDRVDVLVVDERVRGGMGVDLIKYAMDQKIDLAAVLLVEPREGAKDTVVEVGNSLVHCLVKPIGDFALRNAIDNASEFVSKRQKMLFYNTAETK
ncbi:hypothetical protein [Kordiimonas sp.]|uniref:hypothetical protein n=1 Tax=Kordiimonas sp. TaxID=1970157 RepID=UPI003A91CB17